MGAVQQFLLAGGAKVYTTESSQSLPAMTSNTSPSGHVISTSSYFGSLQPYLAFDQITEYASGGSASRWSSSGGANEWIQRQTPSPIRVGKYRFLASPNTPSQTPAAWTFSGSNDGVSWTTLDTQSGITGIGGDPATGFKDFVVPLGNRGFFAYHRFTFPDAGYDTLDEIQLLQDF